MSNRRLHRRLSRPRATDPGGTVRHPGGRQSTRGHTEHPALDPRRRGGRGTADAELVARCASERPGVAAVGHAAGSAARGHGVHASLDRGATDARTTRCCRCAAAPGDRTATLALIVYYRDRYGVRADGVRIVQCETADGTSIFIGLTIAAAPNLAALQARSSAIPLWDTAGRPPTVCRPAARTRLRRGARGGDRGARLFGPEAKARWRTVSDGGMPLRHRLYALQADSGLPEAIDELWAADCRTLDGRRDPGDWRAVAAAVTHRRRAGSPTAPADRSADASGRGPGPAFCRCQFRPVLGRLRLIETARRLVPGRSRRRSKWIAATVRLNSFFEGSSAPR